MHRSLISAAVLVLTGLSAAPAVLAAAQPASTAMLATTQLPRGVVPSHYRVSLVPDAKASTFTATATISITLTETTSSITLNAADLAFRSASVAPAGQPAKASAASNISIDAEHQSATFTFAAPLAKGNYQLTLDYSGKIGTQAVGLFSLDYDGADGKKRALYTQFENSDARRMIPSWDEPNYKATFALDVTVPADEMAVSNMPVAASSPAAGGLKKVQFATTPKMSTYLLFFGLGEFERATAMADGTEVGVITKKGALAQSRFALDSAQTVLHEYNDYFGVHYPLPKLDNIAAPGRSQFFGAMENWGAVFTFEYGLLLDPAISTVADKQEVFTFLAHEMAHQWFGDLVTMRWWDDLWLNEGFASWMESRTTARLHPEWHTALASVGVREEAMARDSVATTHPVIQKIDTVEQASQAFDSITYSKGESVIRMLEAYTGSDQWRDGVRAYMKTHAYSNTVSNDLWLKIDAAGPKKITAIAHDFTLQPGVPMINVGAASCANGQTRVTLTQAEFSRDQPGKQPLSWRVPVIAQTLGNPAQARVLVSGGKATLMVPGCGTLLVNAGQSGYYRTHYEPAAFHALTADFSKLAPIDQLGVIADTWALGNAGLQTASDFLDLAKATPLTADPQVWSEIAAIFNTANDLYQADPAKQKTFAGFAIGRLAPVLAQIGWTAQAGEPAPVTNLRVTLIGVLSSLGDPAVIAEARRRYAAQASDPTAMPAPLRKAIMRVVAQHADAATWDALHAAAVAEKTPLIKSQLYDLLGSSTDPVLAQRALDLALTGEPGATDSPSVISRVAVNHPDLAFDFALAHLDQVTQMVDSSSRSRYLPRLAARSFDPAMLGKLSAYANAKLAPGSRRDADTAAVGIQYRIKVRTERLPVIDAWLAKNAH